MKKIYGLWIALAFFVGALLLYVIDSQGGFISTTQIRFDQIINAPYQELLPIQTVALGQQGRSIFIAFVMNTHTLFANLHLGGAWIIAITLSIFYYTKKKRYDRIAKSLTLFNVILFSAGATFALTGVLFFISLFPQFASNAFHIYWWPLFFEAITFGLEILFLYTFWFSWGKISPRSHQFLGYAYAITVFWQVLFINTLAAGMLTPNHTGLIPYSGQGVLTIPLDQLWTFWWNDTVFRLQWHRLAAAVAAVGFLMTMLAMFHFKDRKDEGSRRYWDWVGSYGMLWGLIGLIFQPVLGQLYMMQIMEKQQSAFMLMMHGPRAWAMLLMVGLLAGVFISSVIYFMSRREQVLSKKETKVFKKLFLIFLVIVSVCGFVVAQPAWFGGMMVDAPSSFQWLLGAMDYKYVALFGMAAIGALIIMLDAIFIGDIRETEWGNLPNAARYAGITAGMLSLWIIPVMGYVREGGRAPWTIYQIIPIPGGMQFPTPIAPYSIFLVWLAVLSITITAFWFAFRVIAHQPNPKEEVDEEAFLPEPYTPEHSESQRDRQY